MKPRICNLPALLAAAALAIILASAVFGQEKSLPRPVSPPVPIPGATPADRNDKGSPPATPLVPASGPEAAAAFVDRQTLAVARVDLNAIDLDALRNWVLQATDSLRDNNKEIARARGDVAQELAEAFKWIEDLRSAGAKELYASLSFRELSNDRPPALIIPLAAGTDPKSLEAMLNDAAQPNSAHQPAPGQLALK